MECWGATESTLENMPGHLYPQYPRTIWNECNQPADVHRDDSSTKTQGTKLVQNSRFGWCEMTQNWNQRNLSANCKPSKNPVWIRLQAMVGVLSEFVQSSPRNSRRSLAVWFPGVKNPRTIGSLATETQADSDLGCHSDNLRVPPFRTLAKAGTGWSCFFGIWLIRKGFSEVFSESHFNLWSSHEFEIQLFQTPIFSSLDKAGPSCSGGASSDCCGRSTNSLTKILHSSPDENTANLERNVHRQETRSNPSLRWSNKRVDGAPSSPNQSQPVTWSNKRVDGAPSSPNQSQPVTWSASSPHSLFSQWSPRFQISITSLCPFFLGGCPREKMILARKVQIVETDVSGRGIQSLIFMPSGSEAASRDSRKEFCVVLVGTPPPTDPAPTHDLIWWVSDCHVMASRDHMMGALGLYAESAFSW